MYLLYHIYLEISLTTLSRQNVFPDNQTLRQGPFSFLQSKA